MGLSTSITIRGGNLAIYIPIKVVKKEELVKGDEVEVTLKVMKSNEERSTYFIKKIYTDGAHTFILIDKVIARTINITEGDKVEYKLKKIKVTKSKKPIKGAV